MVDPLTLNCKDFCEKPEGWWSVVSDPKLLFPKDKYKALKLCEQWCQMHPDEDDGQLNWRMFEFAVSLQMKYKAKYHLEKAIQKGRIISESVLENSKQLINRIPG